MTVNRNNFEAHLLDYLEGNLDPLLTADLMAFLAENPEFEKYLPDYDSSLSLSDEQLFTQKNQLKKELSDLPEITAGNFDEFCIASCEGLLDEKDFARLSGYISLHPEKKSDFDLYGKLRLQADTALQYESKNLLKKNRGPVTLRYLYYALGVAASVTLLFLLVFRKPAGSAFTETRPVNSGALEYAVKPPVGSPAASVTIQKTSPAPTEEQQPENFTAANLPVSLTEEALVPARVGLELAKLEPVKEIQVFSPLQPPPVTSHLNAEKRIIQDLQQDRIPASDSFADTRMGQFLRRIDFWKTAESAISGFNYLTESRLSVDRTTDENGKLTSLLIQSESYTITGKIK